MRNILLLISFIFDFTLSASAMPNYDPNQEPIVYDVSYNVALRNKLEDAYDKKYPPTITKTKDSIEYTYYNRPLESYHDEVIAPYFRQKMRMEDCPIVSK